MRRRAVRIAVRVLLALLALVVVAVGVAIAALHTDWGRERVRRALEDRLDQAFVGDVRIGRVEGSVLGELVIRDLEIDGPDGETAITAEVVRIDLALLPLVSNQLVFAGLRGEGVVVSRVDGLLVPQEEPGTWSVLVNDLAVDGAVALPDLHLDDLHVEGDLAMIPDGPAGGALTARGTWRERDAGFDVSVDLTSRLEGVEIASAAVVLGEVVATARDVRFSDGVVTGELTLLAPRGAIARLGGPAVDADLALGVTAAPGPRDGSTALHAHGIAGPATINGLFVVEPDRQRIAGTAHAHAHGPLDGAVTIDLARDPDRAGLAALRGVIEAHGRGQLAGVPARSIDAVITVDDGRARLTAAGQGDDRATARLDAVAILDRAAVVIEQAHLVARAPRQRASADVHLAGRIDAADQIRLELGAHRVRARGIDWRGRGGTVTLAGARLRLQRLRGAIAGGRLAIDATYRRGGRRAGDLALSVHLDEVDLAKVGRALETPDRWNGGLDGQIHIYRRRGAWSGRVVAHGRGVRLQDGGAALDLDGEVVIAPRRVAIDARVEGRGLGALAVDIDLRPPHHLEDPRAWQRLRHTAIKRGRIALTGLDLAALARVAGQIPQVTGRLDGELDLTAKGSNGWLRGRDLVAVGAPAPVDLDLSMHRVGTRALELDLIATLRGLAVARITGAVHLPHRPFDVTAWRNLDAGDLRGATLAVEDFTLDAERARRLGLPPTWRGRADLHVTVAPGLARADATLDLRSVRGGPIARPLDARLHAIAAPGEITASVVSGTIEATGRLPLGLDQLWNRGVQALDRTPLEGRLVIAETPVSRLTSRFGHPVDVRGSVRAEATLDGTLATPTGHGTIVLSGLGARRATLRQLKIDGDWDGDELRAMLRGAQDDGGVLRADLVIPPRRLDDSTVELVARDFDLAPLAKLGPARYSGVAGVLRGRLSIQGVDPARARVAGRLTVAGARLPLGPEVGTLRDGAALAMLRGRRFELQLSGKVGAGTLKARAHGTVDGLLPARAELRVDISRVTLIDARSPRISGRLTARIRRGADDVWRVDARIRRGRVSVPDDPGHPLHDSRLPEDMVIVENGKPPASSIEPRPTWLELLGTRPTRPWLLVDLDVAPTPVFTPELRGQVRADLKISVGDDGIAIDGTVAAQEGSVALFDRRYTIDRALVRFDGSIDPRLDVQLVKEMPQLTMYIGVRGRVSKPDLELRSQPATYTEGQLLTFLLGGSPGQEPGREVADAATGVASTLLSRRIKGRVRDYLPVDVDVLRFDAATSSRGAAFTIGKWFTRKLYVAYRQQLEARPEQNSGEAQLEYWLRPDVLVEAAAGDRGHHDVDLLWIDRW